jgi:GTP-binding nuclear protein Ran
MSVAPTIELKIVLQGESGVGKTSFLKLLMTGMFEKCFIPTIGVEVYPILLQTNHGKINLSIWDCAGQEKFGGLQDGYYLQADGAIYMGDAGNQKQNRFKKYAKKFKTDFQRMCPNNSAIINVVNKLEILEQQQQSDIIYISVKYQQNVYTPFETLLKKITGWEDLEIIQG